MKKICCMFISFKIHVYSEFAFYYEPKLSCLNIYSQLWPSFTTGFLFFRVELIYSKGLFYVRVRFLKVRYDYTCSPSCLELLYSLKILTAEKSQRSYNCLYVVQLLLMTVSNVLSISQPPPTKYFYVYFSKGYDQQKQVLYSQKQNLILFYRKLECF